ncbi:TonB-dependent receptor plug domain-containing protein [Derxia gummosa]|uniref:TonB-dependent receptor plug domain-containing protein n=1 Tax=Derxia gummosa DSM 723 TaxID=1121388 RepID=A0A8B6X9G1_9BURK|nr:TonB-dependent receptor [Derxia gummosa]
MNILLRPAPAPAARRVSVRLRPIALGLAACLPALAAAQQADPATATAGPAPGDAIRLDTVRVTAEGSNALDARRYSTAPKSIVTREEILQFGDSNVGDVLKRLPGVTVGGPPGRPGGEIRMRGMGGGYTQILVNGERMPPGFSIDTLSPEQIERIEVMKAPTAEFGTRAIAGTINIVLSEPLRQTFNEVKLETGFERGHFTERASLLHNDEFGAGNRYNVNANVFHSEQLTETATRTVTYDADGNPIAERDETARGIGRRDGVHLGGRVQWKLDGGDQIVFMPFLAASRSSSTTDSWLAQPLGTAPYATSHTDADSSDTSLRLNTQWQQRINDSGGKHQLELSLGGSESRGDSQRGEYGSDGALTRTLDATSRSQDRSAKAKGKLTQPLGDSHSFVAGWEAEQSWNHQRRTSYDNGVSQLADVGEYAQAKVRTLAGYAQDEWDINPHWSAYAGLRWEQILTRSSLGGSDIENSSAVWSPLFHVAWKPDENARDVVRLSLTRSYKPPRANQLARLPVLSTRPNDPSNPDSAGNAALKPELATGIDLAWEHYFGKRSVTSIGVFQRDISNFIRTTTSLQTVAWSDTPRWVSRPENIGDAVTRGIELEARSGLDEMFDGMPMVNVKASLSLYRSHVDSIAGPYNQIDQQPRAQGGLSIDGRVPGTPLTLGGSLSWTPVTRIQSADNQLARTGTKMLVDVFGAWTLSGTSQLRLSVANLTGRDYETGSSITAPSQGITQVVSSTQRTNPIVSLRWEVKI